ncbi:hypothetical protein B0H34DRAFT_823433 [Crassisporium funariophilum]|nr:hypothetical protein B0H34DRAFT_823433 [Crassisporium funariophilum]
MTRKLEWLGFKVLAPVTYHNLARMLDLQSFPTLRSMYFSLTVFEERGRQNHFCGLITELEELSHQNNTGIKELFLDLRNKWDTTYRIIDREWKKLDDVLGNPSAFPCLYLFTFKITLETKFEHAQGGEQLKEFKQVKSKHLTRLSSRENQHFRFDFLVETEPWPVYDRTRYEP